MTRNLALTADMLSGAWDRRLKEMGIPIALAATAAMDDVATEVKTDGRASIAAAGMSFRWQNTLRVNRYPKPPRNALEPSVYVYHKIPYAGVFEDGATIQGNPNLWIRLPGVPVRIGRSVPFTPANVEKELGLDLVYMESRKGTPLLGAKMKAPTGLAPDAVPRITNSKLRRGANARSGTLRTIPLFFGIRNVSISKRFNIREICETARSTIARRYAAAFGRINHG